MVGYIKKISINNKKTLKKGTSKKHIKSRMVGDTSTHPALDVSHSI